MDGFELYYYTPLSIIRKFNYGRKNRKTNFPHIMKKCEEKKCEMFLKCRVQLFIFINVHKLRNKNMKCKIGVKELNLMDYQRFNQNIKDITFKSIE